MADYIVNMNGIDVLIVEHTSEARDQASHAQRKRLMDYYEKLLELKGVDKQSDKHETLAYIVDNMTEQNADLKANNLENQINRLMAYATKFGLLSTKQPENEAYVKAIETADALLEVIDATECEDIENQKTVEINGNKFIYEKGTLNIEDYAVKLSEIGEDTKGNTWTIYLDANGELVIY